MIAESECAVVAGAPVVDAVGAAVDSARDGVQVARVGQGVDVRPRGGPVPGGAESGPLLVGEFARVVVEVRRLPVSVDPLAEIAVQLSLSVKTVETYKVRIMEKLETSKKSELVDYALRYGLLQQDQQK